jgi:hypothetical protein
MVISIPRPPKSLLDISRTRLYGTNPPLHIFFISKNMLQNHSSLAESFGGGIEANLKNKPGMPFVRTQ